MRKILVANDDGITSDGIARLAAVAKKFGEVWVVAPQRQYSANSHAANFWTPLEVWPVDFPVEGIHAYATSGTPSDCVCVAINAVMPGKPDLAFCGINAGYNVSYGIQYSATCGAAFEAACHGVHTIAFSEHHEATHVVTDKYIEEIAQELIGKPLDQNEIWNVNFPGCTLEEFRGKKYGCVVSQSDFYAGRYNVVSKDGDKVTYQIEFDLQWKGSENTDLGAVINNYISIGKVKNYS